MDERVARTEYGFYQLRKIPGADELEAYYAGKYYQEGLGSYETSYSDSEIRYIRNKIGQKHQIIQQLIDKEPAACRLLDVGCGEGWALDYFSREGWQVLGVDYSDYGCQANNPNCLPWMRRGDINVLLDELREGHASFDCVWLDNVLEHVIEPLDLLKTCRNLLHPKGVLVIEVPNDFSIVQEKLLAADKIDEPYWIAVPDHISYFSAPSLAALAAAAGFRAEKLLGDFPIEWFLFNEHSNYARDKSRGKACHLARIDIENLLNDISVEKANLLYEAFAGLGMGREITGYFTIDRGSET